MKITKELAEFLGIIAGDGYIPDYKKYKTYYLAIAGNKETDREYLENHAYQLAKTLFDIEPSFIYRKKQKTMYLRLKSKEVIFSLEKWGANIGPKKVISIHSKIKENNRYFRNYIRGLFDTDGCLAVKKRYRITPYYPTISLSSKNEELVDSVSKFLASEGFKIWKGKECYKDKRTSKTYTKYILQMNGVANLELWMKTIGFSNPKHLEKYEKLGRGRYFLP